MAISAWAREGGGECVGMEQAGPASGSAAEWAAPYVDSTGRGRGRGRWWTVTPKPGSACSAAFPGEAKAQGQ